MNSDPLILFDGVCNLCNASVQFIVKHEKYAYFKFAPIQSKFAQNLLRNFDAIENCDSVILIENGRLYHKAKAAARIAKRLNYFWILFYIIYYIPSFLTNPVYDWIAHNRYKWFGKRESCMIPNDEIKSRFFD